MDTRTVRRFDIPHPAINEVITNIEKAFDDFDKRLEESFTKLNAITETAKAESPIENCACTLSDELFSSFPDKIDFMNSLYDVVAETIGDGLIEYEEEEDD